jgi:alkylhydroperoxidase family enzyme
MPRVHVPEDYAHDPSAYVWTHYRPEIGAAAAAYSLAVYEHSTLSTREMEAARIKTAQLNGCKLCIRMRAGRDLAAHIERSGGDAAKAARARDTRAPDEPFYLDVAEWRGSAQFSERERLAIEYAERLGDEPQSMDENEEFWDRMHQNFDDGEIVDLTFSIGSWMALGRLTHVLDLDGVCMPTMPAE